MKAIRIGTMLLSLYLAGWRLVGQTTFGSITGTVTDQNGAVIPEAVVTVVNEGTGVERNVRTTASGVYNVPNLPVGSYRVHIEAAGFRGYEKVGLILNANQVIAVDAELSVAAATQTVEVSGAPSVVDTQTGSLAYARSSRELEQLPLLARTAGDFGYYGYVYSNPGVSKGAPPAANGMRAQDTGPTIDGITVMAYLSNVGGGPVQPSMEGIEQVNMQLAGTPAEFAKAASITVVTKSGSNRFHGGAFESYNGNVLNARTFFASTVPFRVYHDFGGSLGGPIRRNKTFFFMDYEGGREAAVRVITDNTPLAAWRTGDFSGLSTKVIDPTTGAQLPGNLIPASRLDPTAVKVQNFFYPSPNFGGPTLQSGNWRGQKPGLTGYTDMDDFDIRADHNFSRKDVAYGRASYRRLPKSTWDANLPLPPVGPVDEVRTTRSAVASWTHIFSPTLLNEFRAGMTRMFDTFLPGLNGTDIIRQLGIQGIGVTGSVHTVPVFSITGITPTATSTTQSFTLDMNYEWTDNVSVTRGAHLMKFGFDAIRDQLSAESWPQAVLGSYNFTGAYTGFGYADFLLGIPQTTSRAVATPQSYLRGTWWSAYAQDQFKLSRKLTLNYGLRWEWQGHYYDRYGDIYSFDRASGSVVVPDSGFRNINPLYPKNIPIIKASQAGIATDSLINTNQPHLYPRFGFAYKPLGNDKTVVRGGYGIYGDTVYGNAANGLRGGPFAGSETFTNSMNNGKPLFAFPNPFLSAGTTATQNVVGINPNLRTPYSQQYTLTVERQVRDIGIRLAYVGTHSSQLVYNANINQPPANMIPFSLKGRTYPIYNTVNWYDNGGNQQYNSLQVSVLRTYGRNLYFAAGWTWAKDLTDTQNTAGFTGPQIQDADNRAAERGDNAITRKHRGYINAVYYVPVGRGQRFLSNSNWLLNGILGGWMTSWAATMASGVYFTPTFSGFDPSNTNTFGPAANGSVPSGLTEPAFNIRPDRVGSGRLSSGQSINNFFDTAAFTVPGCPAAVPLCTNPANLGRFGNSGVNILRGPDLVVLDFAASKYFSITERVRLQFRLLGSNIFNHPNFAQPAANISSPGTVGQITGTFGELQGNEESRQFHISLRVEF
jgi:hypothetical protein